MGEGTNQSATERILGYCTNVHAGTTLEKAKQHLAIHAAAIRERYCPGEHLPIGLWLSAQAANEISAHGEVAAFGDWLMHQNLEVFTFNGFPYDDFHQAKVKHAVYQPDWSTQDRLDYTKTLVSILASLKSQDRETSISTLPIGWANTLSSRDRMLAARNFLYITRTMQANLFNKGIATHIDIEPEPGCEIATSDDLISFFSGNLWPDLIPEKMRDRLRVCHDICHAAVMFEDQREMLRRYDDAGIKIGKVQVSNAIRVDFDALSPPEKLEALAQLRSFEEDRYLHQTCIRDNATGEITFHEDLPLATAAAKDRGEPIGEWRVHFHVPVYLESFGLLGTTRDYIDDLLDLMPTHPEIHQFEVETYAWDVLPDDLKRESLAEGIADELIWTRSRMQNRGLLDPNESP